MRSFICARSISQGASSSSTTREQATGAARHTDRLLACAEEAPGRIAKPALILCHPRTIDWYFATKDREEIKERLPSHSSSGRRLPHERGGRCVELSECARRAPAGDEAVDRDRVHRDPEEVLEKNEQQAIE
jgi:hypothetical protein